MKQHSLLYENRVEGFLPFCNKSRTKQPKMSIDNTIRIRQDFKMRKKAGKLAESWQKKVLYILHKEMLHQ